jgi:hypothetical protein
LTLLLTIVGCCLALLPIVLDLAAPNFAWTIQTANLTSWGGDSWVQQVGGISWPYVMDSDHGGVTGSPSSFTEGGVTLGPPHSGHDDIRTLGEGRYSLWNENIVFSTSDGTDPRSNGKTYVLTGRTRPSGPVIPWSITGAAAAICLALLLQLGHPSRIRAGWGRLTGACRARGSDIALAALPPTLVTILLLLFVPPVLYTIDSSANMALNIESVPLYGPVYMGLLRLVKNCFDNGRSQITVLQILQHSLEILSIIIISFAFRKKISVLLMSSFCTIGGCFGLFSHSVSGDGLAVAESTALLGIFFWVVRHGSSPLRLVAYAVLLAVLALTRYHFMIFGLALPLYSALRLIGTRREFRMRVRHVVSASAATAGGVLLMALTLWTVCLALDTRPSLYSGRQGSHRMAEAARLLPDDQRGQWIERLAARAPDHPVQTAIRVIAAGPIDWYTSWKNLQLVPELWDQDIDALEDSAFHVFAFALDDPAVRAQWLHQATQFFGSGSGFWYDEIHVSALEAARALTAESRATYPWLQEAIRPSDADRWAALDTGAKPWLAPLGKYLALEVPMLATLLLSTLALLLPRYEKKGAIASLTLLLVMVLSFAGITFSNILQLRHLLPESILVYAALGNIIAVFLEAPPRFRPTMPERNIAPT